MMAKGMKIITIDGCDIDVPDLEFEAYWMYEFTPAKLSGPPEDCYPEEWDHEVVCLNISREVDIYLEMIRPIIAKKIQDKCCDLEFDGHPKKWAEEAAEEYQEAKAEAAYQDSKERDL